MSDLSDPVFDCKRYHQRKEKFGKMYAETVWKLAKQLDLSMEELLIQEEKNAFELYRAIFVMH